MGYEVDFLPVGDGSKGGDAIALRYGDLHGSRDEQTVVIVDGGYLDDGEALVSHLETYYKTNRVDIVISTHPDRDHIKGLEVVLERLHVGLLLMHIPENHDPTVAAAAQRDYVYKSAAFGERFAKSLVDSDTLLALAKSKGIEVVEPFAGMKTADGCLRIMGPTREHYEAMLEKMRGGDAGSSNSVATLLSSLLTRAKEAVFSLVGESLHIETLLEGGETQPSNETSVVLMLSVDGQQLLLTGDAGNVGLDHVASKLEGEGFHPGSLRFMQVPHHGSRKNVSPSILNRLLGPKGQLKTGSAFVSCAPKNPEHKHPAKKVTNAFHRRGYPVHQTAGVAKRTHMDAPERRWTTSVAVPFYDQVEDLDE